MMKRLTLSIPRAVYYMSKITPLYSLFNILFIKNKKKYVEIFETEFAKAVDSKYGIATSHARTSLYYTLQSLNLNNNSDVLMSSINLPDMINMIHLCNLNPILIDYKKESFNISISDLEDKVTPNTKVLFLTILNGIAPNLEDIYTFVKKYNLFLIQDLTQSFQLSYKKKQVTNYADVSIYSLCDLKDIHTHRGGMIVTNNDLIHNKIRTVKLSLEQPPQPSYFIKFILEDLLSLVILNRLFFSFCIRPLIATAYKLNLTESLTNLTKGKGFTIFNLNVGRGLWGGDGDYVRSYIPKFLIYTFTDLQARIGRNRLLKIHHILEQRKSNALQFYNLIPKELLLFKHNEGNVYWKFGIRVDDVIKWQHKLLEKGIDSATTNLPFLPNLLQFHNIINKSNTTFGSFLTTNILYIPCHFYLKQEEIKFIAQAVSEIYNELQPKKLKN